MLTLYWIVSGLGTRGSVLGARYSGLEGREATTSDCEPRAPSPDRSAAIA
jgi:hypothetical protein